MPRKNHPHKYILRPTTGVSVWACALPDCNHFMPPHLNSLLEGRAAICWGCEEKFILDSQAMRETKPRCIECRTGIDVEALADKIESTLTEEIDTVNDTDTVENQARIRKFMNGR